MDALRSEIADELTKKSLDKNRIMGLFSKMLDVIQTLPQGGAGGRGPKGEPGARGPVGPAGPAGPAGKCECKCVSAAAPAPAPAPAPAAAPAADAVKKTVRKKKVAAA